MKSNYLSEISGPKYLAARRKRQLLSLAIIAASANSALAATDIVWSFDGVNFNDGGYLYGSAVYKANGTWTWDITTSSNLDEIGGSEYQFGYTYTNTGNEFVNTNINTAGSPNLEFLTDDYQNQLQFFLNDAGSTVNFFPADATTYDLSIPNNRTSIEIVDGGPNRYVVSGEMIGVEVQEPTSNTPPIDKNQLFYTASGVEAGDVQPLFEGGTLRIDISSAVFDQTFTIASTGGTVDTFGNLALFTGGSIGGAGPLTIEDSTNDANSTQGGQFLLAEPSTYTGSTSINSGAIVKLVSATASLPSTTSLTLNGSLFLNGWGQTVASLSGTDPTAVLNLGSTGAFEFAGGSTSTTTYSGTITGSGNAGLTVGGGTLILKGATNYPGPTGFVGGALVAGTANVLSNSSAFSVGAGTLDVTAAPQTVASISIGSAGTLNLAIGSLFTSTGAAELGGALNVTGTPTGATVDLMNYASETGTFSSVPAFTGYTLEYNSTQLDLIQTVAAASLSWDNAGGSGNGTTWDTTQQNFNTGSAPAIFAAGDSVTFNDTNNGHYSVTLNTTVDPSSVTFANSAGNYTLSGSGTIAGTASLTLSGTRTVTLDTVNTYNGGTTVTAGKLIIAATGALPDGAVNIKGGILQLAQNTGLAQVKSLAISGAGEFNVNNNHLLITYSSGSDPITSIAAWLKTGYNNGAWNGPGIISTAAQTQTGGHSYGLGFADGADKVVSGLSSGQIEIKYTLLGDANLDGTVNGSDFSILAANFGLGTTNWDQGNFLYGSSVNGSDFAALAANFGQGDSGADIPITQADIAALDSFAIANALPLPTIGTVPEPATGMLILGGLVTVRRLRRRGN